MTKKQFITIFTIVLVSTVGVLGQLKADPKPFDWLSRKIATPPSVQQNRVISNLATTADGSRFLIDIPKLNCDAALKQYATADQEYDKALSVCTKLADQFVNLQRAYGGYFNLFKNSEIFNPSNDKMCDAKIGKIIEEMEVAWKKSSDGLDQLKQECLGDQGLDVGTLASPGEYLLKVFGPAEKKLELLKNKTDNIGDSLCGVCKDQWPTTVEGLTPYELQLLNSKCSQQKKGHVNSNPLTQ